MLTTKHTLLGCALLGSMLSFSLNAGTFTVDLQVGRGEVAETSCTNRCNAEKGSYVANSVSMIRQNKNGDTGWRRCVCNKK